ncbi:hypothetical protein C8R43DRAFT_1242196, partial [Mycena crocata]
MTSTTCEKCGHHISPHLDTTLVSLPYTNHYSTCSVPEQRAALSGIKSQIDQYRRMVYLLEREQREVETSLALIVYPVLTLPVEIISRIFVDCLPEHGHIKPSPSKAPLLLTQVCHDWREIALSTCKLWCSLDIGLRRFSQDALEQFLATWIPRARAQPLSLTVRSRQEAALHEALVLIPSLSNQLRSLELDISPMRCNLRPPSLPNLEYLGTTLAGEEVQNILNSAPSLRQLRLQSFDLPENVAIPWLTRLDIAYSISIEMALHILVQFPLLAHLGCRVLQLNYAALPPKVFPRLESLSLDTGMDLLNCLTPPNLHRLNVGLAAPKLDIITSFLSRSSCPLRTVDCWLDGRDEYQLRLWLQAFSSVTTLNIRIYHFTGFLSCVESTPSLLPQLENCRVTTHLPNIELDYTPIVGLLQHRRNPASNAAMLHSFCLKLIDRNVGPDDAPSSEWRPMGLLRTDLEWLVADGLEFSVQYETSGGEIQLWPAGGKAEPVDQLEYFW